jgi:type III secretion system (T3SS) SseB-like protein
LDVRRARHGGRHAAAALPLSKLDAILAQRPNETQAHAELDELLLEAEVVLLDFQIVEREDGPRARFIVVPVSGRESLIAFTAEEHVRAAPDMRRTRHPFRVLLDLIPQPTVPLVLNPGTPFQHIFEVDALVRLKAKAGATRGTA